MLSIYECVAGDEKRMMKKMMMMMVVLGVAMGQGVEIGAELVLSSR